MLYVEDDSYVQVNFDFCNQLTKTFLVECLFINSLFLLIGEFAIFSISISISMFSGPEDHC